MVSFIMDNRGDDSNGNPDGRIELTRVSTKSTLSFWRERILFFTLLAGCILGFFAYVPSVYLAFQKQLWWVIAIDSLAYAWLIFILFYKRLGFLVRAISLLCIIYALGLLFTVFFGPFVGGPLWLFSFPIFTGILLGLRASIISLAINMVTLAVTVLFLPERFMAWTQGGSDPLANIILVLVNFIFLNSVATISMAALVKGLKKTIEREKSANRAKEEQHELLKQTNEKLRIEIEERNQAEKEKAKLESRLRQAQKMEAIGTLAGGIAHDFNNILSSVLGYTELAMEDVQKDSQMEENLQQVYTAGIRARDLVRQILAFSRRSESELKPVRVSLIAKESLKLIRSSIPTSIQIHQKIESDSTVWSDPSQLHQIFMNLYTNASQAMEGNGELTVGLRDMVLNGQAVGTSGPIRPGEYLEISIADTGSGISNDIMGSIFEPYFTTKKPGEGTGMGLAVVHGIVKSQGGEIVVESEVGKGSVFKVYLPVTSAVTEPPQQRPKELPTGTERILIVDDEPPISKMIGQTLKGLGYHTTIRTKSTEALELFRSGPDQFDLVITDMTMPTMTGDKLSTELLKINPKIPIIMCTGYSNNISEQLAVEIGIKAFLLKPVAGKDLAVKVREVLDNQKKVRGRAEAGCKIIQ